MNTTVWIFQGLVATALTASGLFILFSSKEKLGSKLSWVQEYSDGMRYFICLAKILGAIGLVVPMYANLWPILTPMAALGIALFMVFAMQYHIKKKEYKDVPATIIFFALSIFIAYQRL
jgi:hypothetical protein